MQWCVRDDSLTRILRDVLIYNQRNIVIPREKDRIRVEIEIAISKTTET